MFAGSTSWKASRAGDSLPVAPRGEQEARPDHVGAAGAEALSSGESSVDRVLRLLVGVALPAGTVGDGTADRHMLAMAHCTGVGGGLLEAAALSKPPAHYPRKVIVFSVVILVPPP